MKTFSIEGFAAECEARMPGDGTGLEALRAHLAQTLRECDPAQMVETLEAAIPAGASIGEMIVYRSPKLTLLYARIPPRMRSGIHNHTVCAVLGQLVGEERSVVYERTEDGGLRERETLSVKAGEVMSLPADAIHHIENPNDTVGRSLHCYGGDFGALMDKRSLWSENDFSEGKFSFEGLLEQAIVAMKRDGNREGLQALAKAIPAVKNLVAEQ